MQAQLLWGQYKVLFGGLLCQPSGPSGASLTSISNAFAALALHPTHEFPDPTSFIRPPSPGSQEPQVTLDRARDQPVAYLQRLIHNISKSFGPVWTCIQPPAFGECVRSLPICQPGTMEVHPGCRVEAHKSLSFLHQGIQNVPVGVGRVPERVFVPVIAIRGRVRVESTLVVTAADAGLQAVIGPRTKYIRQLQPR